MEGEKGKNHNEEGGGGEPSGIRRAKGVLGPLGAASTY